MKKRILCILLTALLLFSLAGCAHKGECESCGQTETLQKFVEDDGDEHWYCNDCYRMYKLFS